MDIRTAKRLAPGSAFWAPSRNSHDPSGWRLQIVVDRLASANGGNLIVINEHGYQAAWFFEQDRNLWAACKIDRPTGATEPEKIIEHLRKMGKL